MVQPLEEKPQFAMGRFSFGRLKALRKLQRDAQKIGETGDEEAADALETRLMAEIGVLVADIPQTWLVDDAPAFAEIDWKNPESFDNYLRGDRFAEFMHTFEEALSPNS